MPDNLEVVKGEAVQMELNPELLNQFTSAYALEMAGVRDTTHTNIMDLIGNEIGDEVLKRKGKYQKDMAEALGNNSVVLLKIDGEIAAIGRFSKVLGQDDMYEMGRMYTFPKFRGRNLSAVLRNEIVKTVKEQYGGESKIILATKVKKIKEINAAPGTREIRYKDYLDICGFEYRPDQLPEWEAEGWTGFIIDELPSHQ